MAGPAPFVIASNSPQTLELPTTLGLTYSAAASGSNSVVIGNQNCRGVVVFVNVSAITGTTPTFTVTIQGVDPVSGNTYSILASAALSATGLVALRVYPGIAVTANSTANDVLPSQWKISTAIGGTTPAVTATVSAVLLP